MYLLSWFIFSNILPEMFCIVLLTVFILFVILLIYILKKIQNKVILIKFTGFLLILVITMIANHYWCYLALILLIAANFGLINDNVINALKVCFNKSPNVSPFKTEKQNQEKQQTEEEKFKEYEKESQNAEYISTTTEHQKKADDACEPNIDDANYKQYIRPSIIQKYKSAENAVISWFAYTYNLNFDKNMVVTSKNRHSMYPDGISQTKNKDIILEVKLVKNQINIPNTIMHSQKLFLEYNELYKTSKKAFEFILAIVVDNFNENTLKLFNEYINKNPNIKIYIFDRSDNVLQKKIIL